jgi:biopolymer transport protein ExbD
MLSLRRTDHEMRIEIMPLIDVIFLLLTFFIYAMALMIRAELLPVEMQEFASGEPAKPEAAVMTVSLDAQGNLFLDREPMTMSSLLDTIEQRKLDAPETVVYIAAEKTGDVDRLPTFLSLYDKLAFAGLDIRLVGKPSDDVPTQPSPSN